MKDETNFCDDFRGALKLDLLTLDQATLEQPSLFFDCSIKWANAISRRDSLKDQLSLARADGDKSLRDDPTDYGWPNPDKAITESWITQNIEKFEDVSDLKKQLTEAQTDVNIFAVAKEACEQRLKALSILTELWKGNYFATSLKPNINASDAATRSQNRQEEAMENNPRLISLRKKTKDA